MGRKVLIITYYWPPVGGSGVQRWLKMSKYLPESGWDPVIFTPENPSFGTSDESLMADVHPDIEVIKLPIWEPYQLFAKLKGKKGKNLSAADIRIKKKSGILDRLFLWIRGNLFIPDPRVFWVKRAVRFLPDILESNKIEAVITTGPPHSLHLIGKKLKKKYGIKWMADFRDPWTEWDLYDEFPMTRFARKRHRTLERSVLQNADVVTTINHYFKKQFEKLGGRPVEVVSNGYDDADFEGFTKKRAEVFTIRHIGILDEMRDPAAFLKALEIFLGEQSEREIKIEFIGNVSGVYKTIIENSALLKHKVTFSGYKPHEEIITIYAGTTVLLLVLTTSKHAPGNTTGKLYEYLASGARILALGPVNGEVANILEHTDAGKIVEHEDVSTIKHALDHYYKEYLSGKDHENKNITHYSRRNQAYHVAQILEKL